MAAGGGRNTELLGAAVGLRVQPCWGLYLGEGCSTVGEVQNSWGPTLLGGSAPVLRALNVTPARFPAPAVGQRGSRKGELRAGEKEGTPSSHPN